jgi:hypothetical protein
MSCDNCKKSTIQFVRNLEEVDLNFYNALSARFPNFPESYSIPISLEHRTLRKVKSSSGSVFCLCDDCYCRIKITSRGICKISEAVEALLCGDKKP